MEVNKNAKRTRPIYSHLDQTSLVNKGFIKWPKRKDFLAGPTREIPSRQDGLISWVANQNVGYTTSCPLTDSTI